MDKELQVCVFILIFALACAAAFILAAVITEPTWKLLKRFRAKFRKKFLAYKGFDSDLQGFAHFQFEIGKTYVHPRSPSCCDRGFHFCRRLDDVFFNYDNNGHNRFCVVEVSGVVDESLSQRKCCTDVITIVRELSQSEIRQILDQEAKRCEYNKYRRMRRKIRKRGKHK